MRRKVGDLWNLDPEDLGPCVCGRRIYVDEKQFAVLHDEPACKEFLDLEPDEFLTYVRRSRGLPEPTQ